MSSPSPAAIGAACNCLALRRAARGIARRYDEAFRPLDLNNGQFSMLTAIAGLQPAGIQRIGEVLGMDRTTVTAALKPLQRRGLVEVEVGWETPLLASLGTTTINTLHLPRPYS